MLCKRKVNVILRVKEGRLLIVSLMCFSLGVMFGWKSQSGRSTARNLSLDMVENGLRYDDVVNPITSETRGRKKLSAKSEGVRSVFKRLPKNFEKNIFPPTAPSRRFPIEPNKIIEKKKSHDKGKSHYFMLFIVKTSPIHTARRDVIRKTWGAVKMIEGLSFNTIFIVGNVGKDRDIQEQLNNESRDNGDILQSDAPEGYRNLPSKVLSAMQWLINRSSEISSDFYTFTDDDCVMNIANIADFYSALKFIDVKPKEETYFVIESTVSSNVRYTQPVTLHPKGISNDVTLPVMEKDGDSPDLNGGIISKYKSVQAQTESKKLQVLFNSRGLEKNFEIYEKIDPNANIQIGRTEDQDKGNEKKTFPDRPHDISIKFTVATNRSSHRSNDFNEVYKQNADNVSRYLMAALSVPEDPSQNFNSKRLSPDAIFCGFSYDPHSAPHRKLNSKWGVTEEVYSEDVYPSFCHGGMYTMSGRRMSSIFAISTVTNWKAFHLEDVLVTGILREKTGVRESKYIRRASDPKKKPLMYYVWDSGQRILLRMTRRWKYFTRLLLNKHFIMEAMKDGKLVTWNNYGISF